MARIRVTNSALPMLLLFGLISTANAMTFTNGDFESPNIGSNFYTTYNDGSTGITGWTVSAPSGNVAIIGAGGGANYPAQSGAQWIDLTGTSGLGQGLTQTFDTNSGHSYLVSFWVGSAQRDGSVTSIVDATVNGSNVGAYQYTNLGSTVAWENFTFSFLSSGASTTLGFFNGNTIGSLDGLDDVSVTDLGVSATPLPTAFPLFATGIAALGLFGWRKRRESASSAAA
jgi:Protein of unknown function (DUF642)